MSEPEPTQEQIKAAKDWCQRFGWMASVENFPRQKRHLAELLASREAAAKAEGMRAAFDVAFATVIVGNREWSAEECQVSASTRAQILDALRREAGL